MIHPKSLFDNPQNDPKAPVAIAKKTNTAQPASSAPASSATPVVTTVRFAWFRFVFLIYIQNRWTIPNQCQKV